MNARPSSALASLLAAVAVASLSTAVATPAATEMRALNLQPFPLASDITVLHATHQIAAPEGLYWTRIDIREVWLPEVAYDYAMFGGQHHGGQHVSRGSVVARNLESCRDLNPWWGSGLDAERPEWCDLWLSTEVFDAVRAGEVTTFQVDSYYRKDHQVTVELVRQDAMLVLIDGRGVELPVLVLESTAGDVLWVHDARDNPYVLRAGVAGVYDWYVTEIYIEDEPPPVEPGALLEAFIPTSSVSP